MPATNERKGSYKAGIKGDSARRNRENATINIRKNKRMEQRMKRRHVNNHIATTTESSTALEPITQPTVKTVEDLPALVAGIRSGDMAKVVDAVQGVRQMLSREAAPPVLPVIEAGLVSDLTAFLARDDLPNLQFEAAWALTNIASTEHTRILVNQKAVAPLCRLMESPASNVREQALWCLGNIAGDCAELRDHVLETPNSLSSLLKNIQHAATQNCMSVLRNAVWTLSNFCRGKPAPSLENLGNAIACLAECTKLVDSEVLTDTCWALSYVSDGQNDRIQAVIKFKGLTRRLVNLLSHESHSVVTPALRTIGNIVSGNDVQTQAVLDAGLLDTAQTVLQHSKKSVRKETCWAVSNIAAGNEVQVETLCRYPNLMKHIIDMARNDDWDVRKEAAWVISNVITGGSAAHVAKVVEWGAVAAICDLLLVADVTMLKLALESLETLLKKGRSMGCEYGDNVDECNGIDALEELQQHESDKIYSMAINIIETYFQTDIDSDDENAAPVTDASGAFSFGLPTATPASGKDNGKEQRGGIKMFGGSNFNFASPRAPMQENTMNTQPSNFAF